jgi:hypothetical protein
MKFIHILVLTLALAAPALCYPSGSSGASDGEIPFGSVAAVSEVQQDKPEDFVQPPAPDPSEAQVRLSCTGVVCDLHIFQTNPT